MRLSIQAVLLAQLPVYSYLHVSILNRFACSLENQDPSRLLYPKKTVLTVLPTPWGSIPKTEFAYPRGIPDQARLPLGFGKVAELGKRTCLGEVELRLGWGWVFHDDRQTDKLEEGSLWMRPCLFLFCSCYDRGARSILSGLPDLPGFSRTPLWPCHPPQRCPVPPPLPASSHCPWP